MLVPFVELVEMPGVCVASKVDLPLETSRTSITGERFEPCVFTAVGDEIRRRAERLSAMATRIRLLTYVGTAITVDR